MTEDASFSHGLTSSKIDLHILGWTVRASRREPPTSSHEDFQVQLGQPHTHRWSEAAQAEAVAIVSRARLQVNQWRRSTIRTQSQGFVKRHVVRGRDLWSAPCGSVMQPDPSRHRLT